jgi:hypothetical protein
MAELKKLEDERGEAVVRASKHLIAQDLRVLHYSVTKSFSSPLSESVRLVGVPIAESGLVTAREYLFRSVFCGLCFLAYGVSVPISRRGRS